MPARGWIRAVREALGISQSQLAQRLKITRQSMNQLEKSEASGSLELKTLTRVARALGCEVGYALLPKIPLGRAVESQAFALAKRIVEETEKQMRLEKQGTGSKFQENSVVELAAELARQGGKRIWALNG